VKHLIALVIAFSVLGLSACNTVRGIGQDIERGGEAIQKSTR
jgi:entericidin B